MADGAVVEKGDQFPIGETEVTCTVTDSGGLSGEASFFVYAQDTIAPEFTTFPECATMVATNIDGYALDLSEFEMTAAYYGPNGAAGGEVSPLGVIECMVGSEPAQGYQIAIGQHATVTCTASDSAQFRAPVGDEETAPEWPNSREQSFTVNVTLDVSADCGFEPPLRMDAPYSARKANTQVRLERPDDLGAASDPLAPSYHRSTCRLWIPRAAPTRATVAPRTPPTCTPSASLPARAT